MLNICLIINPFRVQWRRACVLSARGMLRPVAFAIVLRKASRGRCRLPLNKRRALKEDADGATAGTEETVTFFRDRSAECPGCNRVWLALLEKGVVFNERLVEPSLDEAYPAIATGGAMPCHRACAAVDRCGAAGTAVQSLCCM